MVEESSMIDPTAKLDLDRCAGLRVRSLTACGALNLRYTAHRLLDSDIRVGLGSKIMKGASRYLLSTALAGSVVFIAAQAQAVTLVPFATYTQVGSKTTIEWLHTGALNGSIFSTVPGKSAPGSNPVIFNFLDTSK